MYTFKIMNMELKHCYAKDGHNLLYQCLMGVLTIGKILTNELEDT